MHPVLAAGIWPGVEQGVAQRSVLPPPALALVPTAVSLWRGWVSGPDCSAVGMWGGAQMGPIFPWPQEWNMLIMALQGAEEGTWASFQTAG